MEVSRLAWVGVRTAKDEDTVRFFRDVLGLRLERSDADVSVLRVPDGSSVEVFGASSRYNRHLTGPVPGFLVDDLRAADAELRSAGVEIVLPIQQGDTGSWLHFRAPDGSLYELAENHPASAAADAKGSPARFLRALPVATGGSCAVVGLYQVVHAIRAARRRRWR